MKPFVRLATSLGLAASSLFVAQHAHALAISLDDNAGHVASVVDSDGDGVVSFFGALGVWTINSTTGLADPAIGSPEIYSMHLNSVNVSNIASGSSTMTVMITDTDLTKIDSGFIAMLGGLSNGNASFTTYISTSNTAFALDTLVSSGNTFSGAFSDSDSGFINVNGPYSMTLVANITHYAGIETSSFDYQVEVPEPMSLALFGAGLTAMGFVGRRKRKA